jgi:hypothetical protein
LSKSSENSGNKNLAANVFANDNTFWETADSFSQIDDDNVGTSHPTYNGLPTTKIHENGEWLDISIKTIHGKPREYFLTQVTLSFVNGDGDMRTGHIMGKNNNTDSPEYKMLKMMGDYSPLVNVEHMSDKIHYQGDDVVHTYNLNPSDPHDTFRFIFSQLQSGESLKVKRIQMKGTRQNYNINAFDSHLEHFTNYESSHEKRSDSFDTITKTLFDYDNGDHKYSMFLIPSVLLFLSTILIIKNKI